MMSRYEAPGSSSPSHSPDFALEIIRGRMWPCLVNITPSFIFSNCQCQKCIRECLHLNKKVSSGDCVLNKPSFQEQQINWVRRLKEFKLVYRPQSESVKACEVRNKKLNYLQPCECKKIQRSINCAPTFLSVPCLDTKLIAMKLSVELRGGKDWEILFRSVEEIQDIYKVSNNICTLFCRVLKSKEKPTENLWRWLVKC